MNFENYSPLDYESLEKAIERAEEIAAGFKQINDDLIFESLKKLSDDLKKQLLDLVTQDFNKNLNKYIDAVKYENEIKPFPYKKWYIACMDSQWSLPVSCVSDLIQGINIHDEKQRDVVFKNIFTYITEGNNTFSYGSGYKKLYNIIKDFCEVDKNELALDVFLFAEPANACVSYESKQIKDFSLQSFFRAVQQWSNDEEIGDLIHALDRLKKYAIEKKLENEFKKEIFEYFTNIFKISYLDDNHQRKFNHQLLTCLPIIDDYFEVINKILLHIPATLKNRSMNDSDWSEYIAILKKNQMSHKLNQKIDLSVKKDKNKLKI